MVAEPRHPHSHSHTSSDPSATKRRSLRTLAIVAAATVIVILVLAILGLDTIGGTRGANGSHGKVIVAVDGHRVESGSISVWLKPGSDVRAALQTAGLRNTAVVDMGGDRFVVSLPAGSETSAIARLHQVSGVIDAGNVYAANNAK